MPRDPLEPKVLPKISVVICTFNRHDMLLDAIMSIELQDLPGQEYELIIVDNEDPRFDGLHGLPGVLARSAVK